MKISFFGKISDPIGKTLEIAFPESGMSIADIRQVIAQACRADMILDKTIRAAVNDEVVLESHIVMPGDDVIFMSALSGG